MVVYLCIYLLVKIYEMYSDLHQSTIHILDPTLVAQKKNLKKPKYSEFHVLQHLLNILLVFRQILQNLIPHFYILSVLDDKFKQISRLSIITQKYCYVRKHISFIFNPMQGISFLRIIITRILFISCVKAHYYYASRLKFCYYLI